MPKLRNQVSVSGTAGVVNGITTAQAGVGGVALTINGSLAKTGQPVPNNANVLKPGPNPGSAPISSPGNGQPIQGTLAQLGSGSPNAGGLAGQQVIITSSASDVAISFKIVGLGPSGEAITEVLPGSATAATSVNQFSIVYSITPSGATAGTVQAGTTGTVFSPWLIGGSQRNDYTSNLEAVAVGTVNYDVQATSDPNVMINSGGVVDDIFALQTGKSASQVTALAQPWYAYRVKMNATTGTVILRLIESRTA